MCFNGDLMDGRFDRHLSELYNTFDGFCCLNGLG